MKTSFFFILWAVAYLCIFLTGSPALINNSFIVVLIVVFALSYFINRFFAKDIAMQRYNENINVFETIYTGNYAAYKRKYLSQFTLEACSFFYLALVAVASLIFIRPFELFTLIIFAFFAYASGRQAYMLGNVYKTIKDAGRIIIPNDPQYMEAYNRYAELRSSGVPAKNIRPAATSSYKALKAINLIASVLCILLGLFFIVMMLLGYAYMGSLDIGALIQIVYGSLALLYGVRDLMSTIKD